MSAPIAIGANTTLFIQYRSECRDGILDLGFAGGRPPTAGPAPPSIEVGRGNAGRDYALTGDGRLPLVPNALNDTVRLHVR